MKLLKRLIIGVIFAASLFTGTKSVKAGPMIVFPNLNDQFPIYSASMKSADQFLVTDYQAVATMQYMQQVQAQYAAALAVQQNFLNTSQTAFSQAYMLNAIQEKQRQQYDSMISGTGLPYAPYLLDQYNNNIAPAQAAFINYEGVQLWMR